MSHIDHNAFEAQVTTEALRITESLGDINEDAVFDFCTGCPRLNGHAPHEVQQAKERGWFTQSGGSDVFNGSVIGMQLEFPDGSCSQNMVLGGYEGWLFTSAMVPVARASAAQRTQECKKPRAIPPFLGPLAVKLCPAIRRQR
ncbi:MAG TPA: hypothetical protein VHD60_04405 [Candidatus Saccharimonadales bacterium]|nr:hypothetical protein [Candidatus Saccharimonadales bacterium]